MSFAELRDLAGARASRSSRATSPNIDAVIAVAVSPQMAEKLPPARILGQANGEAAEQALPTAEG